jgi:DNA-binding NarL/FixJ family response regulator
MITKRAARGGPARKRILVVDDHPIFREGLLQSISRQPDLTVCGEAENGSQALTAIARLKPDLVLVDLSMPGKSGFELVKDIRAIQPDLAVLVLSMHDESLYVERVLRAGARGYIMKHERPKKLLEAIRQVLGGKTYVSERMAARILDVFSGRRPLKSGMPLERLTDREFEVLHLMGRGKNSHEIAKELHLSVKTVDTHRSHLKEKLKLKSALQLTRYAVCWAEGRSLPPP